MRRPRYTGEAAVNEAVSRLMNKFEYPDELGEGGPFVPSGGGGAPTIVIAASNSIDLEKSKADYVCTGVNDQEVIQAALNQLLVGGRLLFCAGTFNISFAGTANCVSTGGFSGVTLEGMGTEATIINVTDSFSGSEIQRFAFEFTDADIAVKSLTLQGGDAVSGTTNGIAVGNHCTIRDVLLATDGIGIRTTSGSATVDAVQILSGTDGIQVWGSNGRVTGCEIVTDNQGINVASVSSIAISECRIQDGEYGIVVEGTLPHDIHISACDITNLGNRGINIDGSGGISYLWVVDNFIQGVGRNIIYSGLGAIHVIGDSADNPDPTQQGATNAPQVKISRNQLENLAQLDGIHVQYVHQAEIKDNHIENPDGHGIVIEDTAATHTSGNRIIWPGITDNTYDAIRVVDSDLNFIDSNYIVNDNTTGNMLRWRYGINVASGTCNIVVGNVLGPVSDYGTDALNDAGADTQLFWPADPTYGDNFIGCYGS